MGAEAVRLLSMHPYAEVTYLGGHSSAGEPIGRVRPGLEMVGQQVHPVNARMIAEHADVAFLALPHGESAEVAAELLEKGLTVFDLGSDFRLEDPADVQKYYGRSAPSSELLDRAVYCLPELTGAPPEGTKLVACPGCFATALNLLLAGLAPLAGHLDVFGITGASGSGISPGPGVHFATRSTSFTAYKSLRHQHQGEVDQLQRSLGNATTYSFVPHSAPLVRGIMLSTVVRAPAEKVLERLQSFYEGCRWVTVLEGAVPLGSVTGTNRVVFGVDGAGDETAVFCAIDNLVKGGSGQAVQVFNLMHGFDETAGLPTVAMWP